MKMKRNIIGIMLGLSLPILNSCTNEFVDINSNIETIYDVEPERFLYNVQTNTRSSSWEWYYDYYCAQMRWLQYGCRIIGNTATTFTYFNSNIFEQRYRLCFLNTGSYMKHMEYCVNTVVPESERSQYSNVIEAARVTLIYQGIATSDSHGSLAYTEGWALRSGGDIDEPSFDTQQELYEIWDGELKDAVAKFKSNTNQKSMSGYDLAFDGDVSKWIKTANALRLRIASRYLKRDKSKALQIASEVLSQSNDLPSSIDDSFIFWLEGRYTNNGDLQSINDLIRPSNSFMAYLNGYNDPRKRMFYIENELTEENLNEWNTQNSANKIPTDLGRWVGGTASFDNLTDPAEVVKYARNTLDPSNRAINMQPVNRPQVRVFSGNYNGGGGGSWFPNITYAEFCFLAAEFSLLGVNGGKSAENWYTDGVVASLKEWSKIGRYCDLVNYQEITQDEIDTFLQQEGIKWNDSKGLEQIYAQSYVTNFKNSLEAWSLYKRTGYPNANEGNIIQWEQCSVQGTVQRVPRRMRFSYPLEGTANYANQVKRIDDMKKESNFGENTDEFGRVWWDID
ncbi:MAG: SusD/RagB family nutrient-binding outer membrane lipoprotein [Phocaeicola sp.]